MLFRILQFRNMAKEGLNDPKGFAKGQAKEAIIGALMVPVIGLILFLALLFVLSYTQLLGGPYGVAKFFFWLLTIAYAIGGFVIYTIYSTIKKAVKNVKDEMKKNSRSTNETSNIRDAEIIEE